MTERKKKAGKVVRLSKEVEVHIRKRQHAGESFDATLRRMFGIRGRKGQKNDLRVYYILPNGTAPKVSTNLAEARGEAIILATKKGLKKAEAVLTVQEIA